MSSINTNMASITAQSNLTNTQNAVQKSLAKLSSGYRINKASDDAAGLAISEKMRGQIRGLQQASRNAQDGISMLQTAEGALNESHAILQRMRELADQSSNGTNTADDRNAIQAEIFQLKEELDRIGNTTEFNTQKLLNGSLKAAGSASVGQNTTSGSVVAKQTAGYVTGAMSNAADTDFVTETITIDGMNIDVHWEDLTSEEKTTLKNAETDVASKNKAAALIESKINDAIDANGGKVAHVNAYFDGTNLVVESGTKGTNSEVIANAANGVVVSMSGGTETAGTSVYNGSTIAGTENADLRVNGVLMELTLPAATGGSSTMSAVATALQTAINSAITTANTSSGKSDGEEGFIKAVTVKASDDGRFVITSESGPVSFADRAGGTGVADLGLSQAQTDASGNGGMTFQIGANQGQSINFGIGDMRSASLGISGIDVSTQAGASNAITLIDKAIQSVSSERSKLGAIQNRLEHTISNLGTAADNLIAAESNIRDVDMAAEMTQFTKNQVLAQAGVSMLAQANQSPQMILKLLG